MALLHRRRVRNLREKGLGLADTLLVAAIFGIFLRTWLLATVIVESRSMVPALQPGDNVLVNRFVFAGGASPPRWLPHRPPHRGDIVELRSRSVDLTIAAGVPELHSLIKRCVARGPATVAMRDKRLVVDQEPAFEPFARWEDDHIYPASALLEPTLRYRDNLASLDIAADELFLLGDNRDYSVDSRFFGAVATNSVRGRPFAILWTASGGFWSRPRVPGWLR